MRTICKTLCNIVGHYGFVLSHMSTMHHRIGDSMSVSQLSRCYNRTCFTQTLTCDRLLGLFYQTCRDSRSTTKELNMVVARRCNNSRPVIHTSLGRSCRFMLGSLRHTRGLLGLRGSCSPDISNPLCSTSCFGRCAVCTLHTHMSLCVRH